MFIDFLKYDDAQHYFVYTDKQIYKFRYLFRFKLYEEIINNLVKIQINYMHLKNSSFSNDDENEKQNLKLYNLNNSDEATYEKVIFFRESYFSFFSKKNMCFYCKKKAHLRCQECKEFYYCSENHQKFEWNLFHFFDCNIIQFLKEVEKNDVLNCTSMAFLNLGFMMNILPKFLSRILMNIFKFTKDEIDYQENMFFINTIIEILDVFNAGYIYRNYLTKLLIYKPEKENNEVIFNEKLIILKLSNYYLSLKLLYVKFAFESIFLVKLGNFFQVAIKHLNILRELLLYLKIDVIAKVLNMMEKKLNETEDCSRNFFTNELSNQHQSFHCNYDKFQNPIFKIFFFSFSYFKSTVFKYMMMIDQYINL